MRASRRCRGKVCSRGTALIALPLHDHNFVLVFDLEGVVEQGVGFVLLDLLDHFRYERGYLDMIG